MDTTEITLSIAEVLYLQGLVKDQIKETERLRARMAQSDPFRVTATQRLRGCRGVLSKLERAERDLRD